MGIGLMDDHGCKLEKQAASGEEIIRFLIPLAGLIILVGCNRTPTGQVNNRDDLIAYTDVASYTLDETSVQVTLSVENRTDSTSYFPYCGSRYVTIIHHVVDDTWEHWGGWGWPCPAIYPMGILPLDPCSLYTDVFNIDNTGTYRFLLLYQWESQAAEWFDTLFSNEFSVQ